MAQDHGPDSCPPKEAQHGMEGIFDSEPPPSDSAQGDPPSSIPSTTTASDCMIEFISKEPTNCFPMEGTSPNSTGANPKTDSGPEPFLCAGCGAKIVDRFLLKALEKYWHEDCLKCVCCECRLGEVGSSLYTRSNLILCKRDYLRLFGATGLCAACNKNIPAFEMVMRARSNVYHLECFACQECNHRFCVGDKFYLCDNKILCEYDYEERMVFANIGTLNYPGLAAQLKRQIQQSTDLDEVRP